MEGNNSSSRNEFRLLPDPVEQIRSLVQTQNHHMRSALLAAKELESAWFATQQMYSSGGSSNSRPPISCNAVFGDVAAPI